MLIDNYGAIQHESVVNTMTEDETEAKVEAMMLMMARVEEREDKLKRTNLKRAGYSWYVVW